MELLGIKQSRVDPWKTQELGALTLHAVKNPCITYSRPSTYIFQFICVCGSRSSDSTNLISYSTVVFTIEKNPCISGPTLFKPTLFNGQLCTIQTLSPYKIILASSPFLPYLLNRRNGSILGLRFTLPYCLSFSKAAFQIFLPQFCYPNCQLFLLPNLQVSSFQTCRLSMTQNS